MRIRWRGLELPSRVVRLYEPVAVEEHARVKIEGCVALLVVHSGHQPERHAGGAELGLLGAIAHERQTVSGVRIAQVPARRLEDPVEAGHEHVLRDLWAEVVVDSAKDRPRVG